MGLKNLWHLLIVLILLIFSQKGISQNYQPLAIPDTLSGPILNLTMATGQKSLLPGNPTPTLSYNNFNYLGPTLMLRKGWQIEANVLNQTTDTTTLHWHGLHVSAHTDGGPHVPILPGQQWNPHFTCMDKAGTYWYHPHFHGKTGEQTMKGATGLILVRDAEEAALLLPRKYGVDDFPLVIQSLEFDPGNQILPKGLRDSVVLVNGTLNPYLEVPAQWVRFRILNASNARNFTLGFSDNRPIILIGNDGGLLGKPLVRNRISITPGERQEVMINFSGLTNQVLSLKSFGSEIPIGTQGGPLNFAPVGTPSMQSSLNGADFEVIQFRVGPMNATPVTSLPDSLAAQKRLKEEDASFSRFITFTSANPGSPVGPFLVNDSSFKMERIDFRIPVNQTEIWTIHNQTVVAHPFHLHGFTFYILDRYGNPVGPEEAGRKDMVLLYPNEVIRIIVRFSDFADTTMPYMYHCHILTHEDEGMMGQFLVVPSTTKIRSEVSIEGSFYPNPFADKLMLPESALHQPIRIMNAMGQTIFEGIPERSELETTGWPGGIYCIVSNRGVDRVVKK